MQQVQKVTEMTLEKLHGFSYNRQSATTNTKKTLRRVAYTVPALYDIGFLAWFSSNTQKWIWEVHSILHRNGPVGFMWSFNQGSFFALFFLDSLRKAACTVNFHSALFLSRVNIPDVLFMLSCQDAFKNMYFASLLSLVCQFSFVLMSSLSDTDPPTSLIWQGQPIYLMTSGMSDLSDMLLKKKLCASS